jgi:hypothetical protein
MLKNFNKHLLSGALALQLAVLGSLAASQASAAPRCSLRDLFVPPTAVSTSTRTERPNSFSINKITGSDQISLKPETLLKIKQIFAESNLELRSTDLKGIIEEAAGSIKGRTRTPSIERANKMAEMGRKILAAAKGDFTGKPQKNLATYMVAESVLRLETFSIDEYKTGRADVVFKLKSVLHINKFNDMVESYVDGSDGYSDHPEDGGVLEWRQIRELYSNNSWIIGLKDHDMYHLHYSYGHPLYLAVNFHSSRSINDRRYLMISALWESVDTFTTSYESNIADYFRSKRMSSEEGMLFLGSATEKELDAVEEAIGSHTDVSGHEALSYSSGWRPTKTKFGRGNLNYTSDTFLAEITAYINDCYARLAMPAKKKYGNYHREGPGVSRARGQNSIPE